MQETKLMAHFRSNLKQLMLKKSVELDRSLNRSDVATATGLSLPTVSRWYKGRVEIVESNTVEKLIGFLGCTYNELVEYVSDEGES
jgi:DNA-binding Xre family transcriptional regulator